jgi:3'(2'), 5'-bisphosphate nucleotidase
VDKLNNPSLVPTGSSLKFLIIAKGEAHVYPRLGPTMEWDTAAAQAVLEHAGGSVINEETKQPLRYNKENLLNPYFIAYGGLQQ